MKIGILGTGTVGKAIGHGFVALGHDTKMGARDAANENARAWVAQEGAKASSGTFADAARFAEVVVLAAKGTAALDVLRAAGAENLAGKVLIDATNPLDESTRPPALFVGHTDSLGERVQREVPAAKVVKAFNTIGNHLMFKPELPGGPPDMFIAGDDDGAKKTVGAILVDFGHGVVDIGPISSSRWLEAMCMAWVFAGIRSGNFVQAFKMLRK